MMQESLGTLQSALAFVQKESPGMSVRAISRKVGVTPSYLSKVFRGEKPLTPNLLPKVARALRLSPQQTAELQRGLVERFERSQLSPNTGLRLTAQSEKPLLAEIEPVGAESYRILEKWYYVPILNLVTLRGQGISTAEIARRLGICEEVTLNALEELKSSGHLVMKKSGWARSKEKIRFPVSRTHPVIRKYHVNMLKRAKRELTAPATAENFAARQISSLNFVGSEKKLTEARALLQEAIYKVATLMAEDDSADQVYQLNLQLFPMTKRDV